MNRAHPHLEPYQEQGGQPGAPQPAPTPAPAPTQAARPPSEVTSVDDASTQALSEALRSSFRIIKFLMVGLVLVFIASGIFTVEPNQVALKLRFGRPVGTGPDQLLKPGLHWAFPEPIDEIVRIPIGQSHSVVSSVGWYAISPQEEAQGIPPTARPTLIPLADGYTLTADGNIIHVRASVKYRISDALAYAFKFANVSTSLQNVLNNAILYASARYPAVEALYLDRGGFKELVLARVNQMIEQHQLGITLEPSDVETAAPLFVKEAFDEVQRAEQDRSTKINNAQGDADVTVQKAVGEAQGIRSAGLSSSNQLVQAVSADAKYFLDQLPYYEKDPELFRARLLTERISRIMTNAQEKWFIPDHADGQPWKKWLHLNREVTKPKPTQQRP